MKTLQLMSVYCWLCFTVKAFLIDPEPTKVTTMTPMQSSVQDGNVTTGSCDIATIMECMEDIQAFYLTNITNSENVDALLNFTCGPEVIAASHCLEKVSHMCDNRTELSTILHGFSSPEQLTELCSDGTGFKDFGMCFQSYKQNPEYKQCIESVSNSSANTITENCQSTKTIFKCNGDAINSYCPAVKAFYEKYSQEMLTFLNCSMNVNSTNSRPVYCNADIIKACQVRDDFDSLNANATIDYYCSPEGTAALQCMNKDYNKGRCSNGTYSSDVEFLLIFPSLEEVKLICSKQIEFKAYWVCVQSYEQDLEYIKCMAPTSNSSQDSNTEHCSSIQQTYECTLNAINTHCPEVKEFFQKTSQEYLTTFSNCSIHFINTSSVAATPQVTTAHQAVASTIVGFGETNSALQRSYLLQMLSHLRHQAQSLETSAKDLNDEAELIYNMVSGGKRP